MNTELVEAAPPHPMMLVQLLIEKGCDPDKLSKMMDIAERHEKIQAEKAFNHNMSAAQAEMTYVVRDKKNDNTGKKYACYESLNAVTKPIYTKYGFSLTWTEGPPREDGQIHVVCEVRHSGGHLVVRDGYFSLDDVGLKGNPNKTKLQAKGSTYSYGRRYLEKFIWNLAEADEDTDGNRNDFITEEEEKVIEDLLKDCSVICKPAPTLSGLLKWIGVERIDLITREQYAKVIDSLRRKLKEGR